MNESPLLSVGASPSATGSARTVAGVFASTPFHWVGDGFHVSTYFPRPSLPADRVSPFLLMDYGPPQEFAPLSQGQRGVGWHPHRGFETVTVAWEGSVAHRDSAGNSGIIGPGDVQWMTAAAGILHEEYHEREFARRGGRMHMMQLWVNLPKKHKMAPPGYQPLASKDIPVVQLPGGMGTVRVIAGEFSGARGPARTFTPLALLDVHLAARGRLTRTLPEKHNAMAIVTSGTVSTGGRIRLGRRACPLRKRRPVRQSRGRGPGPRPRSLGRAARGTGGPIRSLRDEYAGRNRPGDPGL